jgi:uncharacterized damage-inducible protein DinB
MVRLEAVLESWKTVRQDTAQAVLDMPELDYQPTAELMKFRDIAAHILNAGHALAGLLLDGEEDMSAPGFREKMAAHFLPLAADAPAEELAEKLRVTLEEDVARLAGKPAEFWSGMITRFDGQRLTRLEMLQFVKEHELTHRSQMFVYLRLKGVVPVTTRRKMVKK